MKRALPAAIALLGAALHLVLLAPDARERSDLPLYLDSSLRWATGEAPYRDFKFEYPPAALLVLRAPLHAAAASGLRYETAFALWMAVFDALALLAAFRAARLRGLAVAWAGLALCASVLHTRFDLAPGALMAVAVAFLPLPALAGAALGAAAAIKLYPLAVAPALAVAVWRRGGPRALATALGAGAGAALLLSLPAALAGGAATFDFFAYHAQRGVQMQSLWSALVLVENWHREVPFVHVFGAEQLASAPAWMGPLSLFLQLATGLAAASAVWRGRGAAPCALAAFAGFVAFGKVGSPQFLVALAPLAGCAAVEAMPAAALCLASCALMAWEFPRHFGALFHNQGPWAVVVLARQLAAGAATLLGLRLESKP